MPIKITKTTVSPDGSTVTIKFTVMKETDIADFLPSRNPLPQSYTSPYYFKDLSIWIDDTALEDATEGYKSQDTDNG